VFTRWKTVDGKKRRYLVESYRDKSTGKIRQRHLAYVDLWPRKDIAKLVFLIQTHRKHMADSENTIHTKAFRRGALDKAVKMEKKIKKFVRNAALDVLPARRRVDRRRINQATGVSHLQKRIPCDPWCQMVSRAAGFTAAMDKLENEMPMEKWPAEMLDNFLEDMAAVQTKIDKAKKLRLEK